RGPRSAILSLVQGGFDMNAASTLSKAPARPMVFRILRILSATIVCAALSVPFAEGRIIRIEIVSTESPTFGGRTFGSVGAYEKLRGRAFGEVDPSDPRNALITDLARAPRNARGMVEYAMDIYILKPIDLGKGNHKLFFEINNRGQKLFAA